MQNSWAIAASQQMNDRPSGKHGGHTLSLIQLYPQNVKSFCDGAQPLLLVEVTSALSVCTRPLRAPCGTSVRSHTSRQSAAPPNSTTTFPSPSPYVTLAHHEALIVMMYHYQHV